MERENREREADLREQYDEDMRQQAADYCIGNELDETDEQQYDDDDDDEREAMAIAAAEATMLLETLPPVMTLGDITNLMDLADRGGVILTSIQLRELGERARFKVDGYEDVITTCELEAEKFAMRIKAFSAARKRAIRKAESLQAIAVYHMQAKGIEKLPGNDWSMTIKATERLTPKQSATAGLFVRFGDYIRASYGWKKRELKSALKSGRADLAEVAEITKHYKPVFKPFSRMD